VNFCVPNSTKSRTCSLPNRADGTVRRQSRCRPEPAGDPELVLRYQTAYEDARRKRIEGENNLGRLEPFLKPGSDLTGLPDLEYPDVLRSYLARLGETRATLDNLRLDGKGEEHPQVLARKAEASNSRIRSAWS